jgi:hypothetical protein
MDSEAVWNPAGQHSTGHATGWRGARAEMPRRAGRLCLACGSRRPLFAYRGVVKADRDHNLCFECYRAELNRLRAKRLGEAIGGPMPAGTHPRRAKDVVDRGALLADLATRRRRAQIQARHALEAPGPVLAAEPLAS